MVTEVDYLRAVDVLENRFEWLLANVSPHRKAGVGEIAGCFGKAVAIAQCKSDADAVAEWVYWSQRAEREATQWPPPEPEPAPDVLAAFWNARPMHRHLFDAARARRAAPWAVLGAALARVVVATPPVVVLPALVGSDASLNLFIGIVGASGDGKGAALGAAADALHVADVGSASVGSGEGLTHAFVQRIKGELIQHTTALLVTVGEVDTLAALNARQGATLQPMLRQAYMGEAFGFGYADPTKRLEVAAHSYRLALVVGVQPKRAGGLLDDADGGTPQRFLWLPATDAEAPDIAPELPALASWKPAALPAPNHRTGRRPMPVCDTARLAVDTARLDRMRGKADALDGHAVLTRLKVGAALALLDGRAEVSEEDWSLAGVVMAVSDATRGRVMAEVDHGHRSRNRARGMAEADRASIVGERIAGDAVKRVADRLLRRIRDAGADGIAGAELRRTLASRDRALLDDALTTLSDAGRIVAEAITANEAGRGGAGHRYRVSGGPK